MKKSTIVLALMLMIVMPMMAEHVTPETARKVATTFLNNNGAKSSQLIDLSKAAGFQNLYVFSTEESFVIMAADDCVKPILGYSLTGKFVAEAMPKNLVWWLQGYNNEIQYAIDKQAKATSEIAAVWKGLEEGETDMAKSEIVVNALIQTRWKQREPFNNHCPTGTVTGCVATAMAQLMKYYEWPKPYGIGTHSYIHSTYGLQSADFYQTAYDWDNMKDYYGNGYTSTEAEAVATLLYHCGVSVNMKYGNSSSALASDIPHALINYFNYSRTAEYRRRYPSDSTAYWIADMKAELDAGRPMEYDGIGNAGGHSFICDGYRTDDYFHFNWGWANNNDGFFTIDNLNPSSYTFNDNQAAVFGIKPAQCGVGNPTNFSASLIPGTRNVSLSWDVVTNAVGYKAFRNGVLIGTFSSGDVQSYIDEAMPYGTNTYYLRSLDSAGEMSLPSPSEYISITVLFPAPTNLTATTTSSETVSLSWDASENAVSYNVYCNDVLQANVSTTSFEDLHPIPGNNTTYYVKGVDILGDESDVSNSVSVTVPFKSPVVNDLSATMSDQGVSLSWSVPEWCYPQNHTSTLSYVSNGAVCLWSQPYYGQLFSADNLTQHVNKALYKVTTYIYYVGTYTLYIYTHSHDGNPDPNSLADTRVLKCSQGGWIDIPLSHPVLIEEDTDLWVVLKHENTGQSYPVPAMLLATYNANACYLGYSPTNLISVSPDYPVSLLIYAYLTDGIYTYNLYDGLTSIASSVSGTNYLSENISDNTVHQYTIKTNFNGSETSASNMAGLTLGTASIIGDLTLTANDKMTVTEGSKLTISGDFINNNSANLILENGAQLIHNSANVQATVKKNISGYTSDDNGWYFIASPVSETITPSEENGFLNGTVGQGNNNYDLYYYYEPEHLWKNYEAETFNLVHQQGYLYANGETNGTTLEFAGTLLPSNTNVTISDLSREASELNGFNLVGNPFACNATIDQDCYVIDGNQVVLATTAPVLAPCEGVMVKATDESSSVTFTKATSAKGTSSKNCFDLVITQDKTTIDRARVRFGKGIGMDKFSLDDKHSQISLWQDGQDFAVAYTNGKSEMPLNCKVTKNGTYTLSIELGNIELDYLHLIDNLTGNDVDLLVTPNYIFEAKTTDYASRFRLVFNCEDADSNNESFAFFNNEAIIVNGTGTLQVVDLLGRQLISQETTSNLLLPTSCLAPGVYVLRLINGDNVKTQKIVIE